MQHYLPGLLHPVELDRDLGEGGSLVGPIPPALLHQLVAGQGDIHGRMRQNAEKNKLVIGYKVLKTYTSSSQFLGFSIL